MASPSQNSASSEAARSSSTLSYMPTTERQPPLKNSKDAVPGPESSYCTIGGTSMPNNKDDLKLLYSIEGSSIPYQVYTCPHLARDQVIVPEALITEMRQKVEYLTTRGAQLVKEKMSALHVGKLWLRDLSELRREKKVAQQAQKDLEKKAEELHAALEIAELEKEAALRKVHMLQLTAKSNAKGLLSALKISEDQRQAAREDLQVSAEATEQALRAAESHNNDLLFALQVSESETQTARDDLLISRQEVEVAEQLQRATEQQTLSLHDALKTAVSEKQAATELLRRTEESASQDIRNVRSALTASTTRAQYLEGQRNSALRSRAVAHEALKTAKEELLAVKAQVQKIRERQDTVVDDVLSSQDLKAENVRLANVEADCSALQEQVYDLQASNVRLQGEWVAANAQVQELKAWNAVLQIQTKGGDEKGEPSENIQVATTSVSEDVNVRKQSRGIRYMKSRNWLLRADKDRALPKSDSKQ